MARTRNGIDDESALLRGDVDSLLRELVSEDTGDDRRREIDVALRRALLDPSAVAGTDALPAGHELRREAEIVARSFREAAEGRLSDLARAALEQVRDESPLLGWRSLAEALDAAHRGDSESRARAIAAIPEDAAVRAFALLLDPDVAAARDAAVTRDWTAVETERRLLRQLGGGSAGRDDRGAVDPEVIRRLAISVEDVEPLRAVLRWVDWVERVGAGDPSRLSNEELGLVLDRLAALLQPEVDRVMPILGSIVPDVEEALRRIDAWSTGGWPDDSRLAPLRPLATARREVVDRIGQLLGIPLDVACVEKSLVDAALEIDPDPDRFFRRYELSYGDGVREYEAVLLAWVDVFPNDIHPWILLADAACVRGALVKAEKFLEQVREVDPEHEMLPVFRQRIELAQLKDHLAHGRFQEAEPVVARLDASVDDAVLRRFVRAVRVRLLNEAGRDPAGERMDLSAEFGTPALLDPLLSFVDHLATPKRERGAVEIRTGERRTDWRAFVMLVRTSIVVGEDALRCVRWPKGANRAQPPDLPADTDDLGLIADLADESELSNLLHVVSGKGLVEDTPARCDFVVLRWLSLRDEEGLEEEARQCRRLALHLARRAGDALLVSELDELRGVDDTPTWEMEELAEVEARRLLAYEIGLQGGIDERRRRLGLYPGVAMLPPEKGPANATGGGRSLRLDRGRQLGLSDWAETDG